MALSPLRMQVTQMRVIQMMLLVTVILFGVFVKGLQPTNAVTKPVNTILILIGMLDAALGIGLRGKFLGPAESALRENPADVNAVARWRKWTITSLILAYSLGIYGFGLAMYGARRIEYLLFFAVSVALLLLWTPRLDIPSETQG